MAKWDGIQSGTKYNAGKIGVNHMISSPEEWEPQRSNNFELRIEGLSNLKTVFGNEIGQSIAEETLTLSAVSVGQIGINVSPLTVSYGNTKVKYAGLPEISDSEIVFNDYLGKSTERIIAAWHALVFNPRNEKIGRASAYKKNALLIETAPDGTKGRVWKIYGCWPSNVQYGAYDYNSGETRKITMTLTYDKAVPLDD